MFSDWAHVQLQVIRPPPGLSIKTSHIPEGPTPLQGRLALYLHDFQPGMVIPTSKWRGEFAANSPRDVHDAMVAQYRQLFPDMKLEAVINPSSASQISPIRPLPGERLLFQFCRFFPREDCLEEDFFKYQRSVHIVDCDCDCAELSCREFLATSEADRFGFFATRANEKLPRSPSIPYDLFTSCLVTPGQTALFWHSRHYFGFDEGPLRPLTFAAC
jgi:hypothetical protein